MEISCEFFSGRQGVSETLPYWLFRGFFVALFCLEKQCSALFRYFFVAFSWLFRGPRFGQILRVLALEQSIFNMTVSLGWWYFFCLAASTYRLKVSCPNGASAQAGLALVDRHTLRGQWPSRACIYILYGCGFLLTIGSFLLTVELFYPRVCRPWSARCELKHWNFGGEKCLIHGLHFTV